MSKFTDHGEKLTEIPDEYLNDTLPIAKKIAVAQGVKEYNILQNNGALAHQVIMVLFPLSCITHRRIIISGSRPCPLPRYSETVRRGRTRYSVESHNPSK